MKRRVSRFIIFISCSLVSVTAVAQTLPQPIRVTLVSEDITNTGQDEEASPSDVPQSSTKSSKGSKNRNKLGRKHDIYDLLFPKAGLCDAWQLFPEFRNGFQLSGWFEAGVTANEWNTDSRYNGPVGFNDRRDFQVNQLYAVLERKAESHKGALGFGARIDVMFGTDYVYNQMTGWETHSNNDNRWNNRSHYGLVTPQAYGEITSDRLSFKLGRFYSIMGYENPQATSNFFYSHAYTRLYAEPFAHTGGLFTYDHSSQWTLFGGMVNGWDRFDADSDGLAFLGGGTYTPDHSAYSITGTVISGSEPNGSGAQTPRTAYSLVFDWQLDDTWEYVAQHDLGWQEDIGPSSSEAKWYGINQYLYYTHNDCWKFGARFEWFRDESGIRVHGVRGTNPYAGGSSGDFFGLTGGANWTPTENVVIRPELRWDMFDGVGALPFNDGVSDSQITAAIDFVLSF